VLLIQPLGRLTEPSGYMRTCYLEPIALEYLAAVAEEAGYSCQVVSGDVTVREIQRLVERVRPLVVGFSVHSYMYQASLTLAKAARNTAQSLGFTLCIVFGGPHPTALPSETALEPEVDFVVIGEGEETLRDLLNALSKGCDPSPIPGLAFKKKSKVLITGRRPRIRDLDRLPWPRRYRRFLDVAKQYQIAYPPPGRQVRIAQVMYSRGCPYSCAFCSSQNMWGGEVHWRSPKAVLDEIEHLVKDHGTNLVYFPDLTFNVDRERVLALCAEFVARRLPIHWWALFRADLLDEELLHALSEAGCVKISLGLESPNEQLAKHVKGSYRARQEELIRVLLVADALGLIIKTFIIIGFPEETRRDIASYKDVLLSFPIDELRVTFATPFPGTRFWDECLAKRLVPPDPEWTQFTTEKPVLIHPEMTHQELLSAREQLVTGFYLDPRYGQRVSDKLKRFPNLRDSWLEYFRFLEQKGVFRGREQQVRQLLRSIGAGLSGPLAVHG